MINGIIVQNNPLKYVDPRGLNTDRFKNNNNQSSVSNNLVYKSNNDVDIYNENVNNPFYLQSVGVTHYPNTSSTSRIGPLLNSNRELAGLEDAPEWVDNSYQSGTSLSVAGLGASVAEQSREKGTPARSKLKTAGRYFFAASAAYSAVEFANAIHDRDYGRAGKALLDTAMSGAGTFGGPAGIGAAIVYNTLDSLGYVDNAVNFVENVVRSPGVGNRNPLGRQIIIVGRKPSAN